MIARQVLAALRVLLVLTVLFGVAYPLLVTGISQVAMPGPANGSLLVVDGQTVGSVLIGQEFTGPGYFHSRPDSHDPTASGPSNLGPTNPVLTERLRTQAQAVRDAEGLAAGVPLPVDAVTSSASGLDPDISVDYARLQATRVAQARGIRLSEMLALISREAVGRDLGFLGERRVNVLRLNVALDGLKP
jgi:K+-transporting ATPase ATPase C chain